MKFQQGAKKKCVLHFALITEGNLLRCWASTAIGVDSSRRRILWETPALPLISVRVGETMRRCPKTCLTHQKLMKLCCYCRSDRAGHASCQYSLTSQPWCVAKFTVNFLYFFICKEPDGFDDSGSFELTLSLSPSLSAEHPRPQGPDHSRVVCPRRSLPGNVLQR